MLYVVVCTVLTHWLLAAKKALSSHHQPDTSSSQDPKKTPTSSWSSEQRVFSPQSKVVDEVLAIAWQSWQSPVEGVPELVKSIVTLLLEAYEEENQLLGICECKVSVMLVPWEFVVIFIMNFHTSNAVNARLQVFSTFC